MHIYTVDPSQEESSLLSYTRHIYHDFYTKNDITLLLASLAPDVSWCGGGAQMMKSGRTEVMRFFVSTKDEMTYQRRSDGDPQSFFAHKNQILFLFYLEERALSSQTAATSIAA